MIAPGALYLSYLTSTTDTDFFRVNVPATGTRTTIRLSHFPKDYDLVVYGRQGTTPLVQPGSAAPLETPVLADSGAPITHLSEASPQRRSTTSGSGRSPGARRLGVPNHRGRGRRRRLRRRARRIPRPGDGLNSATSVQPYMLRVESEAPRLAPTCQPRFPGLSFGSATGLTSRRSPRTPTRSSSPTVPSPARPAAWASSTGSRRSTSTSSAGPATRAPSSVSRTIRP